MSGAYFRKSTPVPDELDLDRDRVGFLRTTQRSRTLFPRRTRRLLRASALPDNRVTVIQLESIHDPVMTRVRDSLGVDS